MGQYGSLSRFALSFPREFAQLAGAVEYTDCISAEELDPLDECPVYDIKIIWWWGSSNAWTVGNAEYPFIAIAPRSSLTRVVPPEIILSMG